MNVHDLVYDGQEAQDAIAKRFPQAVFEDASDNIHEERFEVDIPNASIEEYVRFMLDERLALSSFNIQLTCEMGHRVIGPIIEQWIAERKAGVGDEQ